MGLLKYIKLSDDLLEHSAANVDDDGMVHIEISTYQILMKDAGWKQR